MLAFVRRGWDNPDDRAPRSTLQAVEYLMMGDTLVRRVRPYLDDARDQPRIDRVLLSGVSDLTVGFYAGEVSGRLNWADIWPQGCTGPTCQPPEALQLNLTTKRFGEIEQLFWIGDIES